MNEYPAALNKGSHQPVRICQFTGIIILCLYAFGGAVAQATQIGSDILKDANTAFTAFQLECSGDGNRVCMVNFTERNDSSLQYIEVYENRSGDWEKLGEEVYFSYTGSGIRTVAFADDGAMLAVLAAVDNDSTVSVVKTYRLEQNEWSDAEIDFDPLRSEIGFNTTLNLSENSEVLATVSLILDLTTFTYESRVQTYRNTATGWSRFGTTITYEFTEPETSFLEVDLSRDGNVIAVHNINSNEVRVFELIDDAWIERGQPVNTPATELYYRSFQLSDDGNILAIGFPEEGDPSINTYTYDGEDYIPLGNPIYSPNGYRDFGSVFDLSGDGKTIVGLSPGSDGLNQDQLHIHNLSGNSWTNGGSFAKRGLISNIVAGRVTLSSDGSTVFYNGISPATEQFFVRAYDITGLSTFTETVPSAEGLVHVFPNPSAGVLHVRGGDQQIRSLHLYSLSGALMVSELTGATTLRHDLPSGHYVLVAKTDRGVFRYPVNITR